MKKIKDIIKKIPWWGWLGIIIFILFAWQGITGASYSRKLWGMVRDQITRDEAQIIKNQGEELNKYKTTNNDLLKQLGDSKKRQAALQAKIDKDEEVINENEAEILALRKERENIHTSSDPDAIIVDLHKLGFSTEHK